MGDFVKLNTALPALKVDARPPVIPEQEIDAADVNFLNGAVGDLRTHTTGWVNVKSYDAKGDGVTDDTAAVVAAYNAVKTAGGTVFFPSGTYLLNLVITDRNIQLVGSGKSANGIVNQYAGGSGGATILKPKDLTKPVLQIGDGTAKVNAITVAHLSIQGDGATATSDGIYQLGAHYVMYLDITVDTFGRDNISITSSATQPSYFTSLVAVHSTNGLNSSLKLIYGPLWTTTIWVTGCSVATTNASSRWAAYIEGVLLTTANCWFETQVSAHGVYMAYDTQTHTIAPNWIGSGTTSLDSPSSTDVLINLDLAGTAFNHRTSTFYVTGVSIDGTIKWDVDSTIVSMKGTYPVRMPGNAEFLGPIAFNANLLDSRDEQSSPTTRILQGGGSAGAETIDLTGAGMRIPGTWQYAVKFAAQGGLLFQGDTGKGLKFSPSGTPSGEGNGAYVNTVRFASTYGASIAFELANGNWFFVAATNGTAFTMQNAVSGGKPLTSGERLTFTISNTSGGALGVITWNAVYKMAAWTSPATGFNRSIEFKYDGTNWIEQWRSAADIPN